MIRSIIDFTGTWRAAFYASGSFQLMGGLLNTLVFVFQLKARNTVIPRTPFEVPKSLLSSKKKNKIINPLSNEFCKNEEVGQTDCFNCKQFFYIEKE